MEETKSPSQFNVDMDRIGDTIDELVTNTMLVSPLQVLAAETRYWERSSANKDLKGLESRLDILSRQYDGGQPVIDFKEAVSVVITKIRNDGYADEFGLHFGAGKRDHGFVIQYVCSATSEFFSLLRQKIYNATSEF
jgi:hypothetical protein